METEHQNQGKEKLIPNLCEGCGATNFGCHKLPQTSLLHWHFKIENQGAKILIHQILSIAIA